MKKHIIAFLLIFSFLSSRADEGMWIPMLIGKNYEEMQRLGLKLTQEDIYSINHSSLKDAILQFGGGCTAEMISSEGLLLTNHHCGYDAIASLSTVERNLLDNGFWALKKSEELPARGVTALFLQRMKDVTAEVKDIVGDATGEEYAKKMEEVNKKWEKQESQGGKYVVNVRSFFNGNQFFLLIYKRYTDVRLVGNPPRSLGKYGGDIDNWMWPRHTSDFSMFRIYADANNEPSAYNLSNVPYKPAKFLPVSIKGVKEGDFAMIMGYPGRTNRYEVSYGIDMAVNTVNPSIVAIRDLRLNIMKRHMDKDKATYLQLTSLYSRISNYWKYFIGQTEQLKRLHVVEKKAKIEADFTAWARENNENSQLMNQFATAYTQFAPYAKHSVYYTECFRASGLNRMAAAVKPLYDYIAKNPKTNPDSIAYYVKGAQNSRRANAKEFELGTEKEMYAEMTRMYYENIDKAQLPDVYAKVLFNKECVGKKKCKPAPKGKLPCYQGTSYPEYAEYVFSHTMLADSNLFNEFLKNPTKEKMDNDAALQYAFSVINNYNTNYQQLIDGFYNKKASLAKEYIKLTMKWKKDNAFYPDANSTMRLTYGKVKSYDPQDAVHYNYFTTLDGLMAKYKPADEDFDVPADLVTLYKKKDYGRYADEDGTLHTCFITNNDITGGNSGSPCINANGELIGTAFDGNWEAMSGDIAFDKKYKRTIVCDIRFVLFLIDKLGKAPNIINEMEIRD
ncbi:MAG: S46 family peptidase [Chitinophagia bacterium]|nr:S46 family peptidase [Chitinophagia bacterium]